MHLETFSYLYFIENFKLVLKKLLTFEMLHVLNKSSMYAMITNRDYIFNCYLLFLNPRLGYQRIFFRIYYFLDCIYLQVQFKSLIQVRFHFLTWKDISLETSAFKMTDTSFQFKPVHNVFNHILKVGCFLLLWNIFLGIVVFCKISFMCNHKEEVKLIFRRINHS